MIWARIDLPSSGWLPLKSTAGFEPMNRGTSSVVSSIPR